MKKKKNSQSLISLYDKESSVATELRRVYSNLKSKSDDKLRSLLITSAMVGEGKSISSSYLSLAVAHLTQFKVLLIDFDLRRSKIHEYFRINQTPGIADILMNKAKIKSVSRKTIIPNLTIITSGKTDSTPSEIFDQADISALFQELKFYFDFIVVDSPPVIPVFDPLILSGHIDGVLLVVKTGSTQREVVNRAVNLLKNAGVSLLGVVLNDYEDVLPYYYKDRYYGYHYAKKQTK